MPKGKKNFAFPQKRRCSIAFREDRAESFFENGISVFPLADVFLKNGKKHKKDNFKAADRPMSFSEGKGSGNYLSAAVRQPPQMRKSPFAEFGGRKKYHRGSFSWLGPSGGMEIVMKQRKTSSAFKKIIAMALASSLLVSFGTTALAGKTLAEHINFQEQIKLDDVLYDNNYYVDYVKEKEGEFSDVTDAEIKIDVNNYTSFEGKQPEIKTYEGKENVFYTDADNESVTWEINVEKAGFYQFRIEYLPVDGNTLAVSRAFKIDGEYPYDELEDIKLRRHWVDTAKPKVNNLGDEVRPSQTEIQEWTTTDLYDSLGEYSLPLKVALTAGKHTITMYSVDQPLAIASFSLVAPVKIKTYAEVKAEYEQKGYKPATQTIRFEAEDKDFVDFKTESTMTIGASSDSTLTPVGITSKKYNYIGGGTWSGGDQTIQWEFEVKESGLYKLAPRYIQSYGNGFTSTRQIMIDGNIPFEEWIETKFTYDEKWITKAFSDENGDPYLIYLSEGKHTLSMRVVMGEMTDVIHRVTDVTSKLSNAIRNITMITGQSPDLNYDYRLERQIPSLIPDLNEIVTELKYCVDKISGYTVKRTPIVNNFTMSYELVEEMINKPSKIPAKLADLTSSLTSIGTWLNDIKSHGFGFDYIQFTAPDAKIVSEKSTFWDSLYATFATFILSYTKDYSAIGQFTENNEEYETIDVWISRGKEQAEIVKDLTDSDFTEKYKVNVKINVLPQGALGGGTSPLLLAINAGTEPDVVLSIAANVPTDYAMRNATYDLTKFEDFEDYIKYTYNQAVVPLTYEGGVYGLPETLTYKAMYYRTDVFEQLDFDVPNTWDDVVETLLPQLYQYNMQFGMLNDPGMMIYQNNARYYTETGYTSLVDSPEFLEGYDRLVKMYTDYGCPVSASVLNRFRSGEMPICVDAFDLYIQLVYSAPELVGKWKMVPIPATVQDDGSLNRCSGAILGMASCILATTDNPEASWDFIKWFNSTETQVAFGRQNESILGVSSRILPANIEAFKKLPWTKQELEVIEVCFDNSRGTPAVLGGYFTGRHITNAYTSCVTQGKSVREELERAAEAINKELRRKQIMYGVNPEGLK